MAIHTLHARQGMAEGTIDNPFARSRPLTVAGALATVSPLASLRQSLAAAGKHLHDPLGLDEVFDEALTRAFSSLAEPARQGTAPARPGSTPVRPRSTAPPT